jgi:hypothetical protein
VGDSRGDAGEAAQEGAARATSIASSRDMAQLASRAW